MSELVSGVGFPVEHQGTRSGDLPFIKVGDLRQSEGHTVTTANNYVSRGMAAQLHARVCPPGTVLFPKVGGALLTNRRAVLGVPAVFDNNVMGAIPTGVEPAWLYLWFCSVNLARYANTQSLPSIRQSTVAALPIPVPPVDVQQRITARLDEQLSIVEGTSRQLSELRALAQALRIRTIEASFAGLGQSLSRPLGELGSLDDGDWILSNDYAPTGVRLFQVGDIGRGALLAKSSRFVSQDRTEELRCTILRAGDILISRMPDPIGRACTVPELPYPSITAVDVTIFRPDAKILDREFVVQFMNSNSWLADVAAKASGATRQRISRANMELLLVPTPPLDVQRTVAAGLREHLSAIDALESAIRGRQDAIHALRAALLRRAFDDVAA